MHTETDQDLPDPAGWRDVPVPSQMAGLPRDRHGRVVPWFVADVNGTPDHRIARSDRRDRAVEQRRCWLCGRRLTTGLVFAIGPMCAINRRTAEPPSHRDCVAYSLRVCPFLTRPGMRRRDVGKPAGMVDPPGKMVLRNPGVMAAWATRSYTVEGDGAGRYLFRVGAPVRVSWWTEARPATRDEVVPSYTSGVDLLRAEAALDGPYALGMLAGQVIDAWRYLPGGSPGPGRDSELDAALARIQTTPVRSVGSVPC